MPSVCEALAYLGDPPALARLLRGFYDSQFRLFTVELHL